jgi:hypothetical protein
MQLFTVGNLAWKSASGFIPNNGFLVKGIIRKIIFLFRAILLGGNFNYSLLITIDVCVTGSMRNQ